MQSPDRPIWRELTDIAWPIIGLNVLNVLALAIDTAMCGRLPNSEVALTGLGFATQILFLLMVAMIGLTVGSVALVARAHGAGDPARVQHVLEQSTLLTVGLALVVATLGNLVAGPLVSLLGADEASLPETMRYLTPLLTGVVFNYLAVLYGAVLRGAGDTRTPFAVAFAATGINIAVNYGLILGNLGLPSLGVQGAAIGTLCSQAFSAITLALLLRGGIIPHVKMPSRLARVEPELARTLVRVGLPAALDMVVLNAAFLSIIGMLGRIDPLAVAAHGLGLRIQALAFVPGMSVSQATGVVVGQHLGHGDAEGARSVVKTAIVLCSVIMTSIAAVILSFDAEIVSLFGVDPTSALGGYSLTWMQVLGYGLPVVGIYIAFVGMLHGAGATSQSLRINLATTFLFQVPASYVLGFPLEMGAYGVWVAFPLAFVFKAALGAWVYREGSWARTGKTV